VNTLLASCLLAAIICFAPKKVKAGDTLFYNNKYSVACHNCYQKKYSSSLEEALAYTSTLELDIWDSQYFLGKKKYSGTDWFVKHSLFQKGNKNCVGGSLRKCLQEIEDWTKKNPEHEVLTIYIDKKEDWGSKRSARKPQDLDDLISSIFPAGNIYSPKEVLQENENLRNSVHGCNWPSTEELKGKIIFVITDATILTRKNKLLNKYLSNQQNNSLCFVAPLIKKNREILNPRGLSTKNTPNVIFYNLGYKHSGLSSAINSNNYINRVYNSPETLATVHALANKKVNFIALHNYKLAGCQPPVTEVVKQN
jgi:hypothetical protein